MAQRDEELLAGFEERWDSLTLADDFVFGKVMLDEEVCREVVEAILETPVDRVEYVHRHEDLDVTPEGHAVQLDVYVRDGLGTVYNVEMQASNTGELPQRSRYYQSMLTFDQLERGTRYRSLRNSYVIFICGFDLFGKGRRVYSFEYRCADDEGLLLGDGSHIVFLSWSSPADSSKGSEVNELLDYVSSGTVAGGLSSKLDAAVSRVLGNPEWKLEYMMLYIRDQLNVDEGRRLGFREGHETGFAEGRESGLAEGRQAGLAEGRESGLAEGRQAGLAEGRESGLAEGRQAGLAEGESRLAELIAQLVAAGRADEVPQAAANPELRRRLYVEYGLGDN